MAYTFFTKTNQDLYNMGQTAYSVKTICPEAYALLDDAQNLADLWGYDTVEEFFDDWGIGQAQLTALKSKFHYWPDFVTGVPSRDVYACLFDDWVNADLEHIVAILTDECDPSTIDVTTIYFSSEVPFWY